MPMETHHTPSTSPAEPFPDPISETGHAATPPRNASTESVQESFLDTTLTSQTPSTWSVSALADKAGVSEQAILKAIKEGRVSAHHVKGPRGPRWAISNETAQSYLETRRRRPLRSAPVTGGTTTRTTNLTHPATSPTPPDTTSPSTSPSPNHPTISPTGDTAEEIDTLKEENRRLRVQLEALTYAHRKLLETLG